MNTFNNTKAIPSDLFLSHTAVAIRYVAAGLIMAAAIIGIVISMTKITKAVNEAVARNPERKTKFNFYLYLGAGLIGTIPLLWAIVPVLLVANGESGKAIEDMTQTKAIENIAKFSFVGVASIGGGLFEAPIHSKFVVSAIKAEERNPEAATAARVNMFIGFGIASVPGTLGFVFALINSF